MYVEDVLLAADSKAFLTFKKHFATVGRLTVRPAWHAKIH